MKALFSNNLFYVRKLEQLDINEFYELLSSYKVMQYVKPTLGYDESLLELNRFISYYDKPEIFYNIWAVVDISNNSFIGICGVYQNSHNEYEIAFRLREKYWRQGLGKLISEALIHYCKHVLNLSRLVAFVHPSNIGSVNILKSLMKFHSKRFDKENQCSEEKYELYLNAVISTS